ncbi:MAG TPA: MmgE/PrpD family protein [Caldimonas sp.]|nr:MmgE/PrpD family protein [Caldimonas sp.]
MIAAAPTPNPPSAPDPAAATIATRLAAFAHDLRLERVPAEVSVRARHLMLDAIGCAMAARGDEFASRLAAGVADLAGADHGGRAGVVGFAARLPKRDAALLNGMLMHGLDYDDTHMTGIVHLTVSVLPTLLALGGERGTRGADVLVAYIAALEAGARIASAACGGFHAQGFHPTGVVGALASAIGAGRILGLAPRALAQAQGIALSMASGSLQFLEDGAWTKRMHPGWAAQAAITAATLAARDVPAPLAAYEGRFGLYRLYLGAGHDKADLALATAGLDGDGGDFVWELTQIAVKPYAICHFSHAIADAAVALHKRGIAPARIRSVEARLPAGTMPVVAEPAPAKRRPTSDYDAKFSAHYAVASGLLRGRLGLRELMPAAFTDAAALALMDRVTCTVDAASTFPRHYSGEVIVTLDDGTTLGERQAVNRGHAERPLGDAEVRDKFFANATLHFPEAHARAVCDAVLALDRAPSVTALEDLLAVAP